MARAQGIVFRQSAGKLMRVLPLAAAMAAGAGLVFWLCLAAGQPIGAAVAGVGLAFFGPALLILLHALIRPSYLQIDADGLAFRFYSVECAIPWHTVREVSGGVGWPALTFHDCQGVARAARFRGFRPLGWILEIPTRLVSQLLRQPLANIYPTSTAQLLRHFRANEQTFGFHYGMPTSLLEATTREIVDALRRGHRTGG